MDGHFTIVRFSQEIDAGTPSATLLPALANQRYNIKKLVLSLNTDIFQPASSFHIYDTLGDIINQSGDGQIQPVYTLEDIYLAEGSPLLVASSLSSERLQIYGWAEVRG